MRPPQSTMQLWQKSCPLIPPDGIQPARATSGVADDDHTAGGAAHRPTACQKLQDGSSLRRQWRRSGYFHIGGLHFPVRASLCLHAPPPEESTGAECICLTCTRYSNFGDRTKSDNPHPRQRVAPKAYPVLRAAARREGVVQIHKFCTVSKAL